MCDTIALAASFVIVILSIALVCTKVRLQKALDEVERIRKQKGDV